ncbi:MAG: hypothetical protein ACR2N3_06530 [Pyrinomonadaceae bacterium]
MNKNNKRLTSIVLIVVTLTAMLVSGWIILQSNQTAASAGCKVTVSCPDNSKISCEGEDCESNSSAEDPYCISDDEITRCSDKKKDANINTENGNRNKNKKKGENIGDTNASIPNTSAANGNTQ